MIVAGFDEAGYGPKLGPLVLAWTAFRVPDAIAERCLWKELNQAVRAKVDGPPRKIWIADSKVIKPRTDGLKHLELGALAFIRAATGLPVRTVSELLLALGDDPRRVDAPWYDGLHDRKLPAHGWDGEVRAASERLVKAAGDKKIELAGAAARIVLEHELNDGIQRTDSKSLALFSAFGPLLLALRLRFPGEKIVVVADKHGSRDYYGSLLGQLFPGAPVKIDAQGPDESTYRIGTPAGPLAITFKPEADSRSLPVELASMFCKYTRELFMDRLNAYFLARLPSLKPTAGYPGDAERFLREAEPALAGLPLERLVRAR